MQVRTSRGSHGESKKSGPGGWRERVRSLKKTHRKEVVDDFKAILPGSRADGKQWSAEADERPSSKCRLVRETQGEGQGSAPGRVVHGRHVHQRLV